MTERKDYARIRYTLNRKPYLELIENSVSRIPQRIRRIEPGYFIVWNKRSEKFEVHSTQNEGDTFCLSLPYPELDDRTLMYCMETNIGNRGDAIVKDMDYINRRVKRAEEKARHERHMDVARDMSERAAHGVDQDELHSGYSSTHVMK